MIAAKGTEDAKVKKSQNNKTNKKG